MGQEAGGPHSDVFTYGIPISPRGIRPGDVKVSLNSGSLSISKCFVNCEVPQAEVLLSSAPLVCRRMGYFLRIRFPGLLN